MFSFETQVIAWTQLKCSDPSGSRVVLGDEITNTNSATNEFFFYAIEA